MEIPMLVAIRLAVLAVREALVFLLKTGWRFGRFCLGSVILFFVIVFHFLQLGPQLKSHAIENMCDTSFLQRIDELLGYTTREKCYKGHTAALKAEYLYMVIVELGFEFYDDHLIGE